MDPTNDMQLLVVNFHHVWHSAPADMPNLHGRTVVQLERQLDELARKFEFISPSVLQGGLVDAAALPRRGCVLTFDDGLAEHAELVTPLLQERGLRAFFFVCSAPHRARALLPVHRAHVLSGMFGYGALRAEIEAEADRLDAPPLSEGLEDRARAQYRYDDLDTARTKYYLNFVLTPAQRGEILKLVFEARLGAEEAYVRQHYATPTQVRGMVAAGMTIGMHGDHHVALATLAEEDVREDLRVNRDLIEEWTGERPRWVSYPYGGPDSFSPRVTAVAREIGAVGGFTMIRSINTSLARPLRIGRVDTNDAPGGKRPIPLEDLPCASQ